MTNNDLLIKYYDFLQELKSKFKVNDDCMQIIYLEFLNYDNKKLMRLDKEDKMKFWLVRFVKNNWYSKTSRYYYQYNRYYKTFTDGLDQFK